MNHVSIAPCFFDVSSRNFDSGINETSTISLEQNLYLFYKINEKRSFYDVMIKIPIAVLLKPVLPVFGQNLTSNIKK